jgi:hypothetical protein
MTRDDKLDRALDAALEMTFPASDPIAVYAYDPRSTRTNAEEEGARPPQAFSRCREGTSYARN